MRSDDRPGQELTEDWRLSYARGGRPSDQSGGRDDEEVKEDAGAQVHGGRGPTFETYRSEASAYAGAAVASAA